MLKQETRGLLEELSRSMHGKALRDFLQDRKETIGDIKLCTSWEQTVGRQFALELIDEIFKFLEEKKQVDKIPNQYQ
jgi:hypothetical protein